MISPQNSIAMTKWRLLDNGRAVYKAPGIVDGLHEKTSIFDGDNTVFVLNAQTGQLDVRLGADNTSTANVCSFLSINYPILELRVYIGYIIFAFYFYKYL